MTRIPVIQAAIDALEAVLAANLASLNLGMQQDINNCLATLQHEAFAKAFANEPAKETPVVAPKAESAPEEKSPQFMDFTSAAEPAEEKLKRGKK